MSELVRVDMGWMPVRIVWEAQLSEEKRRGEMQSFLEISRGK